MRNLTDSEIIYYIKQNKEEAYKLLLFKYKKNMGKIIEKIGLDSFLYKDGDLIKTTYFTSLEIAISSYSPQKGFFNNFFEGVFKNKVFNAIKRRKIDFKDEIYIEEPEDLADGSPPFDFKEEIKRLLDLLEKENGVSYHIVLLWMSGLSYDEIAQKINITSKCVAYNIRKSIMYLRKVSSLKPRRK